MVLAGSLPAAGRPLPARGRRGNGGPDAAHRSGVRLRHALHPVVRAADEHARGGRPGGQYD